MKTKEERTVMETREYLVIAKYVGHQRAGNDMFLEDDFDDLMLRASEGDRRAVGAIAIAFGPLLLEEARTVLEEFAGEAEEVLKDFLAVLIEAKSPFNRAKGPALKWMYWVVRSIAQQRRRERKRLQRLRDDDVA